ncbi:MAG: methyltransferase family protein [Anaerolineae bacterium]
MLSALSLIIFFALYAAVHSLLAGQGAKRWARRAFGAGVERWYRLAYNLLAVITLLPLLPLLALLPDRPLYVVPSPWRWLMVGGQMLALAGMGLSLLQTGPLHFLGLSQLVADNPAETGSLSERGFYTWVRHPLYFFSIVLIWLTPAMTLNLLVVFAMFTLYFYIGSMYEERRLLAEFGPAYRAYQQRVPRLIPRPWRGRVSSPRGTGI